MSRFSAFRRGARRTFPAPPPGIGLTRESKTVRRHHLGAETLGRLAPSLRALPTVIWRMPLSAYLDRSLAEIRQMKTHGEKRVRVVLEVFFVVHQALQDAAVQQHLTIRLAPGFVRPVEQWISNAMQLDVAPGAAEVRDGLALPLLEQLEKDTADSTHGLAMGRIGVNTPAQSVRQQSQSRDLTRARVYQLLDACSKTAEVRWPEGRWQMTALAETFTQNELRGAGVDMFNATRELFFPARPAGAPSNNGH